MSAKKRRGRHTSLSKDLKQPVEWLENQAGVDRVIVSLAQGARHHYAPGTLRVRRVVQNSLNVAGYTGKGVVRLMVIAKPGCALAVRQAIENKYPL